MGAGDDVFQWDPGDGNDTIEGQDGTDTMLFFGSGASENINILANGGRALFLRDVANVTMDLNDVENIDFRALGGADNIVIGDLTGTDVKKVTSTFVGRMAVATAQPIRSPSTGPTAPTTSSLQAMPEASAWPACRPVSTSSSRSRPMTGSWSTGKVATM